MSLEGIPNASIIESNAASYPGQYIDAILQLLHDGKSDTSHTHSQYAPRSVQPVGASSTALALDVAGYSDMTVLWTGNCVVNFTNAPAGASAFTITGTQDSTGGRQPTFPDVDVWELQLAPVIDPTIGAVQAFSFYTPDGGTTWYGFHGQRLNAYPWSTAPGVNLVTTTTSAAWVIERPGRLVSVRLVASVAPTGTSVLVDLNKNGTTMYTTQGNRPSIAVSTTKSTLSTNADVTTIASGDVLTANIDQVGSSTAGQGLSIIARVLEA